MRRAIDLEEHLDQLIVQLADRARPVPSLVPDDAAEERALRVKQLERRETPTELRVPSSRGTEHRLFHVIDQARRLSEQCSFGDLCLLRLDELELDLAILDAWGDSRRVRPLCARRYGCGEESVTTANGPVPLFVLAMEMLAMVPRPAPRPRTLPAVCEAGEPRAPSVGKLIVAAALGIGLDVEIRVEPRLASLAATGERTVFLSARMFTVQEARRLVAHEVFGHLVAAANARTQPLRLLRVGLAGSFADQEGLALYLEEVLGLMCEERLRTLAARVLATRYLHKGASFGETARALHDEHGFAADAAILLAERAFRGGGIARDAGYLLGYVRVRTALRTGQASIDELRAGRVSVAALPRLRELQRDGRVREACYRPSLHQTRALVHGASGLGEGASQETPESSFAMRDHAAFATRGFAINAL